MLRSSLAFTIALGAIAFAFCCRARFVEEGVRTHTTQILQWDIHVAGSNDATTMFFTARIRCSARHTGARGHGLHSSRREVVEPR